MIYTSPLSLHNDVKQDLADIKTEDPSTHAKLAALIRQLRADVNLHTKLTDHGYGDHKTQAISVNKWVSVWNHGKDLWRLKFWELEKQQIQYRIIYVYLIKEARFVVMAIVKRDAFDYDNTNDPTRQRIFASLQRCYGIQ